MDLERRPVVPALLAPHSVEAAMMPVLPIARPSWRRKRGLTLHQLHIVWHGFRQLVCFRRPTLFSDHGGALARWMCRRPWSRRATTPTSARSWTLPAPVQGRIISNKQGVTLA